MVTHDPWLPDIQSGLISSNLGQEYANVSPGVDDTRCITMG